MSFLWIFPENDEVFSMAKIMKHQTDRICLELRRPLDYHKCVLKLNFTERLAKYDGKKLDLVLGGIYFLALKDDIIENATIFNRIIVFCYNTYSEVLRVINEIKVIRMMCTTEAIELIEWLKEEDNNLNSPEVIFDSESVNEESTRNDSRSSEIYNTSNFS